MAQNSNPFRFTSQFQNIKETAPLYLDVASVVGLFDMAGVVDVFLDTAVLLLVSTKKERNAADLTFLQSLNKKYSEIGVFKGVAPFVC